ncbi:MAG: amidohydrolase family protein, partial [Anaerovoracaceae bacterium]
MNIIVKSRCIFDGKRKTPYAGYVKIKEDRIEAVVEADGLPENIQDYRVIDCGDKTIMAGFCDAHVHLYLGAMESATVNVFYSANEEEAAAALYDFYKDDEGPWVIGFGWSHYRWPGEKLPTKESLDRLFPDRPVVVFNDELHGIWVNSKALALCGITKNSPEPKGGLIKRDEEGNPTGYLLEVPAMRLITEKALNMTEDFEEKMLRSFTQKAYQRGVTSVGDVQILNMVKPKVYEKMIEKGALGVR